MDKNKAANVASAIINGPMPSATDLAGIANFTLDILRTGYQSDIGAARRALQPEVDQKISDATAPLIRQISDLTDAAAGEEKRTTDAVSAATQPLADKITAVTNAAQDPTSDPATIVANVLAALGIAPDAPAPVDTPPDQQQ